MSYEPTTFFSKFCQKEVCCEVLHSLRGKVSCAFITHVHVHHALCPVIRFCCGARKKLWGNLFTAQSVQAILTYSVHYYSVVLSGAGERPGLSFQIFLRTCQTE